MLRIIISMPEDDKRWLEQQSKRNHLPMAELIRRAIKHYRGCKKMTAQTPIEQALQQTHGIWSEGDGLKYQNKIREEWDR